MPQSRKLAKWKIFSLNMKRGKRWLKSFLGDKTPQRIKREPLCLQGENTHQVRSKITFTVMF